MRHFVKSCGLAGVAALLAAAAPACAGGYAPRVRSAAPYHGRVNAAAPHTQTPAEQGFFGGGVGASFYEGPFVRTSGYESRGYGRGYGGYGYPISVYSDVGPDYGPPVYPFGYDGGRYEPTGYGVIYNIPPNPPLFVRPGPHIITLHPRHCHCRVAWRRRPITILRGQSVTAAY